MKDLTIELDLQYLETKNGKGYVEDHFVLAYTPYERTLLIRMKHESNSQPGYEFLYQTKNHLGSWTTILAPAAVDHLIRNTILNRLDELG